MYIFYLTIFFVKEFLNLKRLLGDIIVIFRLCKNPIHFFINKKKIIFSDENLNKYLKLNTEIWRKEKYKNLNSKKKILVESLINHPHYLIPNCIIGKKLSLTHNLECVGLIKKNDLVAKKIMQSYGINEIIELSDNNIFLKIKFFVQSLGYLNSKISMKSLINLKIKNIEIGKNLYESYMRYKKDPDPKKVNFSFYYLLSKILYNNYLTNIILNKYKFAYLIQSEKQFIPFRVLFQNALKRKIKIYTRYGLKEVAVKRYDKFKDINQNRASISKDVFNYFYSKHKNKILILAEKYFSKNLKKEIGKEVFQKIKKNNKSFEKKKIFDKKSICDLYNWDINTPIVFVLSHNLIDGNFVNKWNLFINNKEWLVETLKIINKNDHINWFIKSHPSEKHYNSKITTNQIFNKIIGKPKKNIKLFPDNIAIQSIQKISNVIVTSHGSAGFEYPILKKPTIICGDTYYRGFGFNIEPKTKLNYFKLLGKINKIKMINKKQYEKSIIYGYLFKFLTKIKMPMIPYSDITMNYDKKKFWKTSYSLLKKRNKNTNNLFKSLNYQFSNDKENLIDLSKIKFAKNYIKNRVQ
tara:strand:- start:386 stop:2125 length:1740 start_codon:yes stop_codon:yes gene_type:complete